MRLMSMRGVLVRLCSIGKLITIRTVDLDSGSVYAYFNEGRSETIIEISLIDDLVESSRSRYLLRDVNDFEKAQDDTLPWVQSGERKYRLKAEPSCWIVIYLVVTLLNHQVRGDHIVQGLRAKGYTKISKIEENYLGGWNFYQGQSKVKISEVLNDLYDWTRTT